jgi:hypothetical protein
MKKYELTKERMSIQRIYYPVNYIIIHHSGKIVAKLTEKELKSLKLLDASELAIRRVSKILEKDNVENVSFEEMRDIKNTIFEAYLVYDRNCNEIIGYLEDFE